MELTSFYEYIKNTSTGGAVLTEHLLPGPNRRSQTPERTRKVSMQLGRMKGGKGDKWDIPWVSGKELKEEMFLISGKPLHQWELRNGASEAQRLAQLPAHSRQSREACMDGPATHLGTQSETQVCCYGLGLGGETQSSEAWPGERNGAGCSEVA